MDLHSKLRETTKELHNQIERSPPIRKIIESSITLAEYRCLLELFYGYIEPCERIIRSLSLENILVGRQKTALLEQDLLAFDLDNTHFKKIVRCNNLPPLMEYEQVLGYLYVIEGSTLGGQLMTHILYNSLKITPDNGVKYFNAYGKNTKTMWNDFCGILNSITTKKQQNTIIDSANLTFSTLNHWFGNNSLS